MLVVEAGVISRVIKRWRQVDSVNRTRFTEETTMEEGAEKYHLECATRMTMMM